MSAYRQPAESAFWLGHCLHGDSTISIPILNTEKVCLFSGPNFAGLLPWKVGLELRTAGSMGGTPEHCPARNSTAHLMQHKDADFFYPQQASRDEASAPAGKAEQLPWLFPQLV